MMLLPLAALPPASRAPAAASASAFLIACSCRYAGVSGICSRRYMVARAGMTPMPSMMRHA
jgi:hypothetical protein